MHIEQSGKSRIGKGKKKKKEKAANGMLRLQGVG